MTNNALKKVSSHIERQFQIMKALELELNSIKQRSNADDQRKIEEMGKLLKFLARETRELGEEVLENVA
jgi:hypothetical protein